MIDKNKIKEIFYVIDDFRAKFDAEVEKNRLRSSEVRRGEMSKVVFSYNEMMFNDYKRIDFELKLER